MKKEIKEVKTFCDFCNDEAKDLCQKCKKDLCTKHYHLIDTNLKMFVYLCPDCMRDITREIKKIFKEFGWDERYD